MKKIYITPKKLANLQMSLLKQIRNSGRKFTSVVGIANGGLHISKPLAMLLHLPHYSVEISYYDGTKRRKKPVIKTDIKEIHNALIVDDLIDSGGTFETFKNLFELEDNAIAVLFWHKSASIKPDFYAKIKPEAWLVFYWEKEYWNRENEN